MSKIDLALKPSKSRGAFLKSRHSVWSQSIMKNRHIGIFTDYLSLLSALLETVAAHFDGDEAVLQARLGPDMFPLGVQVEIAANFALRSCCPIANVDVVSFARDIKSFANLQAQIKDTLSQLACLDTMENILDVTIEDMAGPARVSMKAQDFLARFALPNFYFHLTMVYAIARSQGVPLSKGDFDGLHQYSPGFSFESE